MTVDEDILLCRLMDTEGVEPYSDGELKVMDFHAVSPADLLEALLSEPPTQCGYKTTRELIQELLDDPNYRRIGVILERLNDEVGRKQDSDWGR
jgi:hypothetical protein